MKQNVYLCNLLQLSISIIFKSLAALEKAKRQFAHRSLRRSLGQQPKCGRLSALIGNPTCDGGFRDPSLNRICKPVKSPNEKKIEPVFSPAYTFAVSYNNCFYLLRTAKKK
jgi:hypothetical protein